MENLDFTIDEQDLRILFLHTQTTKFTKDGFNQFILECKQSYFEYYKRNLNNVSRYGLPKTYSQWVNAQIIALT
jgi:hypothetical protein